MKIELHVFRLPDGTLRITVDEELVKLLTTHPDRLTLVHSVTEAFAALERALDPLVEKPENTP